MSPVAAAAGEGPWWRPPIASTQDGQGPSRACRGPTGTALLGLVLLGLVLYLVPTGPLLAWLAVGATTAWWGLSREPRGPRALPLSLTRSSRRQRTLLVSSLAKSAVNGNLQEPRTLIERLNPAKLLLMGSYLSKPSRPQLATAQEGRDLRERPARSSPPAPAAPRIQQHGYPSLPTPFHRPSRRPAHRDCGTFSNPFLIAPRKRYPIQQAQYSLLGVLPTVCWNGCPKKAVLSARNSKMVCSPGTVRIAPPDSKLNCCPIPEQLINSALPSPSSNGPVPCAKEAVLNALKQGKKRVVEEEDQIFVDGQENKRSRHDSKSGHSPSVPLVANGVPASFVPNPGSLKRGLTSQSSEDPLNKRSRTSSGSSLTSTGTGGILSSKRNAITSSYSSTRGISRQQLWKRSGSISSPFSSPSSSPSGSPERPAKKAREEKPCQRSGSSTLLVANKESQGERVADPRKQQNLGVSSSMPGRSRPRKQKVPLLPSKRRDKLTLPSPPQLGYSITAEDLDLEKKAALQWVNEVLKDKSDVPPNSTSENPPTTQPSFTSTLPVVCATSSAVSWPAADTSPSLENLKKMQSVPGPALPESSPLKTPSLLASLGSLPPGPLLGTSSDSKSTTTFLGLVPASSTAPVTDTKSPLAFQADTSTKAPGPLTPSPTPMQGVQCGISSSESPDPSSPAAPTVSSASPMFKPIFVMAPKSESEGPSPSNLSITASTFPTTTSTATSNFKPIFGGLGAPVAVPLPGPFSCKPTTTVTAAAGPAAPLFAGLASSTSAMAFTTTASVSTDSASQHAFCFGVNSMAGAGRSTTSSMTPASEPFPFKVPLAPAARKPLTMQTSTAVTKFGQSLPGTGQTATTSSNSKSSSSSSSSSSTTGFSGFSTSLTTSAPTTTCQPTLAFSNKTIPALNIPFGSSAKPSLTAATPQPKFGAAKGQQQGCTKTAPAPSLGSPFTFGNSGASAPSAAPAQPASGSSGQSAFGLKTIASAFRVPASTHKAFGAATTSGFKATTQTTSSGISSSVFGSSTPSPFMCGGPAAPAVSGGFGLSVTAPDTSSTSGAFNCGAGQSGTIGTTTPFGGNLSQNALGIPSQSTSFAFNMASTSESKPVFGGISAPTFGRSTPTAQMGIVGSSLSFGVPSTSSQGFVGVGSFGSAAPSFSIGAGSKTPGSRPRLQARRQHTRKK